MKKKVYTLADHMRNALKFHKGFRKDGVTPYGVHPIQVTAKLLSWGCMDDDVNAASCYHDVKEEEGYTNDDLSFCTDRTLLFVDELTFIPQSEATKAAEKKVYMSGWLPDREDPKTAESLVIKVADRWCNTRDFLDRDDPYAKKYYHKASDLFLAFNQREDQIRDISKIDTDRIHADIAALDHAIFLLTMKLNCAKKKECPNFGFGISCNCEFCTQAQSELEFDFYGGNT